MLERGSDLDADEVVGVLKPELSVLVGRFEPPRADQRQQHIAAGYPFLQDGDEIEAGLDTVHTQEDAIRPELRLLSIEQAAGGALGIVTAIVR